MTEPITTQLQVEHAPYSALFRRRTLVDAFILRAKAKESKEKPAAVASRGFNITQSRSDKI